MKRYSDGQGNSRHEEKQKHLRNIKIVNDLKIVDMDIA